MKTNIFLTLLLLPQFCETTLAQNHPTSPKREVAQQFVELRNEDASSALVFPGTSWRQISSLEQAGWSKEKLDAARKYADSIHSSAVMMVQGGEVVDQWGDFDKKISSYSVRKSLISALFGIYSAEGVIDINQTLEQVGIDDSPDPLTKGAAGEGGGSSSRPFGSLSPCRFRG
jgi:hypothetical protein